MRPGLPLSIVLHAAVLGWALVSFAATPPLDAPPASDPIDVELLPPSQTSQPKLGQKTGKPSDQITPKDTKASAKESDGQRVGDTKTEEPPPPPPPETKPTPPVEKPPDVAAVPPPPAPPKPEPAKPDPPKPVAKVEPPPPTPTPPPKPDLPKEGEKAKDIGAGKPPEVKEPPKDEKALEKLLDEAKKPDKPPEKKPDPKPAEKPAPKTEPVKMAAADPVKSTSQAPSNLRGQTSDIVNHVDTGLSSSKLQKQASLGSPTGLATNLKLSQSETEALIGALKAQITPCWNPPPGASESGVKVTLAIALNQDGSLKAEEMIAVSPVSSPLANSIVSSALRAVKMCASQQPFKMPADKYGAWALNHVTFDPKYQ